MQSQHTVPLDKKETAQQLRRCSCPKHRDGKQKWGCLLLGDRGIVDFGRFAGQRNYFEIAKTITELEQYTICVTNSPGIFLSCKNLIPETKYLKFAIGFHPQETTLGGREIKDFMRLISSTNYVGEIGLDYSQKSYMSKPLQLKYFEQIVEICASENKLMTIHIKKAEKDAVRILEKYYPKKTIIHWYTGDCDDMLRLVDLGCNFSINTNMVKGSKKEKNMKQHII